MHKKFKLQKVLDYRNIILEREKSKLAEMTQQEQKFIQAIKQLNEVLLLKQQEMAQTQAEGDFHLAQLYSKYITTIEVQRLKVQQALNEHRRLMHQQKGVTVDAYKRKSIMDKLKDKHKRAYITFIDKEEAKTVEDIVLTRKAARIMSGENDL